MFSKIEREQEWQGLQCNSRGCNTNLPSHSSHLGWATYCRFLYIVIWPPKIYFWCFSQSFILWALRGGNSSAGGLLGVWGWFNFAFCTYINHMKHENM